MSSEIAIPVVAEAAEPTGEPAIRVHRVGKRFELGALASFMRTVRSIRERLGGPKFKRRFVDALDDVSFDVYPGECFACLGRNGSGKSTLLSILSEIILPTSGHVDVRGRVVPLLHASAGFHPEMSGTENVEMLATILGLRKEQIEASMPRIVEFSEIDEDHMETPVTRFSMGMQSRLAFATALCLPGSVYILDEVLATADDDFKVRCTAAVRELAAQGAAVIFVSHELELVRSLCDRGVWLHEGKVKALGPIDEVADAYAAWHGDR